MAAERSRRVNAGSNIAKLIDEDEKQDDFYQTAYGGFEEVAVDEEYEVSAHVETFVSLCSVCHKLGLLASLHACFSHGTCHMYYHLALLV